MSPRVRGTLDGRDRADTFVLWRKPGQYRYDLEVRGEGSVSMLLEAFTPGGTENPTLAGEWLPLANQPSARGSATSGLIIVPELRIDPTSRLEWVRLRLRISRIAPTQSVEYKFYLDPGEHGSAPAPQRTG